MARRQCKNKERSKRLREKFHFPIEREQSTTCREMVSMQSNYPSSGQLPARCEKNLNSPSFAALNCPGQPSALSFIHLPVIRKFICGHEALPG